MDLAVKYGKEEIILRFPEDSIVYTPRYEQRGHETLRDSLMHPTGGLPLRLLLKKRRKGKVVIVVSDITRPIPYQAFLPDLLHYIRNEGIGKEEIRLLVATGMHRPSTLPEKIQMFGKEIVEEYEILDHRAEDEGQFVLLDKKSWSGAAVKLNRAYVEAGFRILTGLVEPHFMAGFSGGRKAICPGLASLDTIRMFHGFTFLSNPYAANTILKDNPCHLENTSIARICPADFLVNIVLDQNKQVNRMISGDPFISHEAAVEYVKERSCRVVDFPADLVVTSSSGYPLDDTFYQCVKGFVNCLPAIKEKGEIIAIGNCAEGIGSNEYGMLMKKYSGRYTDFLQDIQDGLFFIKDQWQFQMHIRAIRKVGIGNLHFYTSHIPAEELAQLSVTGHCVATDELRVVLQREIDRAVLQHKRIAVFPEGGYCAPLSP